MAAATPNTIGTTITKYNIVTRMIWLLQKINSLLVLYFRAYYYMEKDNFTNFDWDSNNNELEKLCHRFVTEDLSVVRVRMAESVFEKAQIRLKQTLTDKVSSFGRKITILVLQEKFEACIYFCRWHLRRPSVYRTMPK